MSKKSVVAALLTACTLGAAGLSYAATNAAPAAPAPVAAPAAPAVSMTAAVAAAEKTYNAKSFRSSLRTTNEYGLVWEVRMQRDDGAYVRAFVDANSGKTVAFEESTIRNGGFGHHMGEGRMHRSGHRGHGGMGMMSGCPMMGSGNHGSGMNMGMGAGSHH